MWSQRCAPRPGWAMTRCRSAPRVTWCPNPSPTAARPSACTGFSADSTAARSAAATPSRPAPGGALAALARVIAVEVVEDHPRLLVADGRAEAILHLLDGLLPGGPIHGRGVT